MKYNIYIIFKTKGIILNKITLTFLITIVNLFAIEAPIAEYRMDECQWIGGGALEVKDNSINSLNGEVLNSAFITQKDSRIGFSGAFNIVDDTEQHIVIDDNDILKIEQNVTFTLWVKPTDSADGHLINRYDEDDDTGFKIHYNDNKNELRFVIYTEDNQKRRLNLDISSDDWSDGEWHFIYARYDGKEMVLSFDGTSNTKDATGKLVHPDNQNMLLGMKPDATTKDFSGYMDEVKIWDIALSDSDIQTIYNNEKDGKNYDGTTREVPICNSSIDANSWQLISFPAELRGVSLSINDLLGDDMTGTYGDDWRVYKREFSDTNNSSWYTYIDDISTILEFGKAYWLGSKNDENWSTSNLEDVDYNATCASDQDANHCVKIPLVSVTLSEDDGDDLQGTGPYRYNMVSFTGHIPIQWSDCRVVVDGTTMTPSKAKDAGYMSNQIWLYNPNDSSANSNGYTTFTDQDTNDLFVPYKGFWVEMDSKSKDKTIELLIPQEI